MPCSSTTLPVDLAQKLRPNKAFLHFYNRTVSRDPVARCGAISIFTRDWLARAARVETKPASSLAATRERTAWGSRAFSPATPGNHLKRGLETSRSTRGGNFQSLSATQPRSANTHLALLETRHVCFVSSPCHQMSRPFSKHPCRHLGMGRLEFTRQQSPTQSLQISP